MRVDFTLTGTTPLLVHNDDVEAADELKEWRSDSANKNFSVPGDDRSPPWTWITYLYTDGKSMVWPSYNLMVGLRQAGAQIIMKRQKTFKEISQSGIVMDSEYLDLLVNGKVVSMTPIVKLKNGDFTFKQHAEAVKDMGFTLFVKRARVGSSKHVRVRARLNTWQIRGSLNVLAKEINFEVLEQLFVLAGRGGQGSWRPACKTPGPFGMFTSTLKRGKETAAA